MRFHHWLVAALLGLGIDAPAVAQTPPALAPAALAGHGPKTNLTEDLTDVWWPNAESGWGIQFVHNAATVCRRGQTNHCACKERCGQCCAAWAS